LLQFERLGLALNAERLQNLFAIGLVIVGNRFYPFAKANKIYLWVLETGT
jgi:hypothetical protein